MDLLYNKYLETMKDPQLVVDFPRVTCKYRQGGSQRFDMVMVGQIVASVIMFEKEDSRHAPHHTPKCRNTTPTVAHRTRCVREHVGGGAYGVQ